MRNIYFLLFWSLVGSQTLAQSVTVQSIPTSCLDQETAITYSSTTAFATDNLFTVDVRSNYNSNYLKTFPATVRDGKLVITISDLNFPDNIISNGLQARINTTKPVLQSEWSSTFYFYRRPTVKMTSSTVQTTNPFEPVGIQFSVDGSPAVNVTLNDSSNFTLSASYYMTSTFTAAQPITPKATTTYTIAQVRNICGIGSGSGSTTVKVNPIGVRTTAINASQLCIGSELRVGYSTTSSGFAATNQFKIRLTAYTTNVNQEDLSLSYDLNAVAENGILKAIIPATIPTQPGYTPFYYTVRIVSTEPATLGDYAGYYIAVLPAPSAEFTSASRTISIGQTVDLGVKFQGLAPYSAVLSDGTLVRSDYYSDYSAQLVISPRQTTTYTIKSLQTGCGSVPGKTASSVVMTVNPGIAIDSITADPICEGQNLRIKFSHNLTLGANNQFFVYIRHNSGVLSEAIPAQQQGNYLLIKVPSFKLAENQLYRNQSFSVQLSSTQPAASSDWQGNIGILTYPTMKWSTSNVYTIDKQQQQVGLSWIADGGGIYQLEMETGQRSSTVNIWDNYSAVYVPGIASGTFRVKTIKNACFTTNNPAEATLTVKNTEGRFIYVKPYKGVVCRGDSIEISFQAMGNFEADNQFRIQVRPGSYCCDYSTTWASTTTGTLKFKLPTDFGWNSDGSISMTFRIASTNPVVFSEELNLTIQQPPYNIDFSDKNEVLLLQAGSITNDIRYLGGTPMTIKYTVSTTDYSYNTNYANTYDSYISYPVTANTTFTLKSIANACGAVPVNRSINYRIVPYLLQTPTVLTNNYQPVSYCAGSTITIPYVMVGQTDPDISVSVQFREAKTTAFRTLLTNIKTNPVVLTLPDTLQTGDYTIRLQSNIGIISTEQTIRVLRKATAQLTTDAGASSLDILPNNSYPLKVNLTGSPDWAVLFNDGQRQVYSTSPGTRSISAKTKTVFAIQAVTNACGYGSASGEVSVTVKPTLSFNTNNTSFCANTKVPVTYNAQGDFGPNNKLKIGLVEGASVRWLDSTSTLQGTFQLTLPSNLTLGNYSLKLVSTNPVQEVSSYFQLTTTPTISLGGNATINPQQTAFLRLTSNDPLSNYGTAIRYTLSTGESGEFYLWNNIYDITVKPTQTTTYRLSSVSNSCGVGQFSGSATVIVNPAAERQITTQGVNGVLAICSNDTMQISFDTKGSFSATNRFTVQLSDSTGNLFTNLATFGTKSPLKAVVPANLPRGSFYHVRVVASDVGVSSSTNPTPLLMRYGATAAFESSSIGFTPGKSIKLKINLTGDAPWNISIGNEFNPVSTLYATSSPYVIDLSPISAATTYKLYQVSNVCGLGKLADPSTVQITVLTATDPISTQRFSVYPNPTTGGLKIRQDNPMKPYTIRLTDLQNKLLFQKNLSKEMDEQDLSVLPAGVYLLNIETDKSSVVFRIIKH